MRKGDRVEIENDKDDAERADEEGALFVSIFFSSLTKDTKTT